MEGLRIEFSGERRDALRIDTDGAALGEALAGFEVLEIQPLSHHGAPTTRSKLRLLRESVAAKHFSALQTNAYT